MTKVIIEDLDIFLFVKLVDDSPTVLSLRMLCETIGFSFVRKTGKQTSLTKDGITYECRFENHVPAVAIT